MGMLLNSFYLFKYCIIVATLKLLPRGHALFASVIIILCTISRLLLHAD